MIIVIPAYNRPVGLSRLLDALVNCHGIENFAIWVCWDRETIPQNWVDKFTNIPDNCEFKYFKHLGLKNHILRICTMASKLSDFIVIEDDLFIHDSILVAFEQLRKIANCKPEVGGIGLYSYERDEIEFRPFNPLKTDSDCYLLQFPCSWGQGFTQSMWERFMDWYDTHKESLEVPLLSDAISAKINNWGENSWKLAYLKYLVSESLFFLYPYISFSTNLNDQAGVHFRKSISVFSVNLPIPNLEIDLKSSQREVKYDSFFEICNAEEFFDNNLVSQNGKLIDLADVSFDINGYKTKNNIEITRKLYVLTSSMSKNPIKSLPYHGPVDVGSIFIPTINDARKYLHILELEDFSVTSPKMGFNVLLFPGLPACKRIIQILIYKILVVFNVK